MPRSRQSLRSMLSSCACEYHEDGNNLRNSDMYRAGAGEGHDARSDVGIGRSRQSQEQTHGGVHGDYWEAEPASRFLCHLAARHLTNSMPAHGWQKSLNFGPSCVYACAMVLKTQSLCKTCLNKQVSYGRMPRPILICCRVLSSPKTLKIHLGVVIERNVNTAVGSLFTFTSGFTSSHCCSACRPSRSTHGLYTRSAFRIINIIPPAMQFTYLVVQEIRSRRNGCSTASSSCTTVQTPGQGGIRPAPQRAARDKRPCNVFPVTLHTVRVPRAAQRETLLALLNTVLIQILAHITQSLCSVIHRSRNSVHSFILKRHIPQCASPFGHELRLHRPAYHKLRPHRPAV